MMTWSLKKVQEIKKSLSPEMEEELGETTSNTLRLSLK
jgi:hypothetical protein